MAFPIKTHTVHNLPFHVSYVSVLPDVTQKPKSYVAFTRYTGFRWGSGSPINWLYWLTRCGSQPRPTYLSELHGTDPSTTSGSALFRCSDARRSSHTHRTGPLRFFCCCSIHLELWTCWEIDCVKTFSLSNATSKPIYSNSLSPPVLHQVPLYLQT